MIRMRGKNAVVYGAGRGVGRAVAMAFAEEGAHVFLAGGARDSLQWVAQEIKGRGRDAEVSVVNPLDPEGVERQLSRVLNERGSLDVSFNLTTYETKTDPRLTGLTDDRFTTASFTRVRSNFITATAAARKMAYQGHGVILGMVSGSLAPSRENFGGFAIGSAALGELFRQLDREVGPRGVRVACLETGAAPDSPLPEGVFGAFVSDHAAERNRNDSARGTDRPAEVGTVPAPFAVAAIDLAAGRPHPSNRGVLASASG